MSKSTETPLVYETDGGIVVTRTTERLQVGSAIDPIIDRLDDHAGVILASTYEYPGRYTRWDVGLVDPPIELSATGRDFLLRARTTRGRVLLPAIHACISAQEGVETAALDGAVVTGRVARPVGRFAEEQRSRQPSVFSVLRAVTALFASADDPHLGFYGAFGYDLVFQFEPIQERIPRDPSQRNLMLYLPDSITVVDHNRNVALRHEYDFTVDGATTEGIEREPVVERYVAPPPTESRRDHEPGQFAELVGEAKAWFARGDLFEVVPGQSFFEPMQATPAKVFRRLHRQNPAPFATLMNLGAGEYLVGASPEMFVRIDGQRVESCPISGTIARGKDVMADADQILALLNSTKDASELTMCTDVDRNDKARICVPGSVRVIGRRQIEMYSRVIHTVDHVEGVLRPEFDALDALLSHAWAVTVTGAPKLWAMRFIEEHERSPRRWYGGAIGHVGFDGNLNTGLTLRTIQVRDGLAEVRAGGTLLADSVPELEERETELKAGAFLDAVRGGQIDAPPALEHRWQTGGGRRVLLVDHEDSFVHTMADYVRQTGARVVTLRAGADGVDDELFDEHRPDLVMLSPGPGRPKGFGVSATVGRAVARGLPIFGVCLGLQGIVEHFGGTLRQLDYPVHGKSSTIHVRGGQLFDGLPKTFVAGRYHSLIADRETLPDALDVVAETEDGIVMAVQHRDLPIAAVQFHPESIMTLHGDIGLSIIGNAIAESCG